MAVIKNFKHKRPTKMLKKAIGGMVLDEIYVHIGRSYDFIEAHCSSILHPDYKYKRFPCTLEGYISAYDWVLDTSKDMISKRMTVIYIEGPCIKKIAASYPRCYDWTDESAKFEPRQFSIELN